MVLQDEHDREHVEKVLDCVEEKNKQGRGFKGMRDAMGAISKCVAENFPDMDPERQDSLVREAERWMEDDFMEPQAVLQTPEGKKEVTRYTSPMGFSVEWSATDAWRGHYVMKAPSNYKKMKSDTILAHHHTEKDLHDMHEGVTERFEAEGIDYVAAFPRTSNVFATGYDLYVKKGDVKRAKEIIKDIAERQGQEGWL